MTLTKTERLILANQYRILGHLDPENADYYGRSQKALERGYESAIDNLFEPIVDGLSASQCSFVINVMAMYDALQRSQMSAGDASGVTANEVRFPGFDGNNETDYMSYARFVVDHEDRFTSLETTGHGFNSHMPSRGRYQAMLGEWQSLGKSYELGVPEMQRVLRAR